VDEIKLFEALQPPPPSAAPQLREAIRARLNSAMSGPPEPRRHRRRGLTLTAALAVAAGAAALATAALLPASHQPPAQLAAWTVIKQPNGTISVTIRELHDPAGLQRTLRADGVLASITFPGHPHSGCSALAASPAPWTVAKQSDGTISVTIRELHDPAGLQRTLRADGVLASITFPGHPHSGCSAALHASPSPSPSTS
jgi:hypothetical protein